MKNSLVAILACAVSLPAATATLTLDIPACQSFSVSGTPNAVVTCNQAPVPVTPTAPPVVPPSAPPANGCENLAMTYIPFNWNADNGRVLIQPMSHGQAIIYTFTTGPAQDAVAEFSIAEYAGSVPTRTVVISTMPCDFSVANAALPKLVGTSGTAYFTVGVTQSRRVRLEANTKYYANIKNEQPYTNPGQDACQIGENCQFRFSMKH